jgi:hypothetical protein
LPSRGFLTAAALIAIALACIASLRKLQRERRLILKLRSLDPGRALLLDQLTEDERDAAYSLSRAGVLKLDGQRLTLKIAAVATFRRKRLRLALSGAFGALLLACIVAILILHG